MPMSQQEVEAARQRLAFEELLLLQLRLLLQRTSIQCTLTPVPCPWLTPCIVAVSNHVSFSGAVADVGYPSQGTRCN